MRVCACVRVCVCVRACVRACMHVCVMRARVCVCLTGDGGHKSNFNLKTALFFIVCVIIGTSDVCRSLVLR